MIGAFKSFFSFLIGELIKNFMRPYNLQMVILIPNFGLTLAYITNSRNERSWCLRFSRIQSFDQEDLPKLWCIGILSDRGNVLFTYWMVLSYVHAPFHHIYAPGLIYHCKKKKKTAGLSLDNFLMQRSKFWCFQWTEISVTSQLELNKDSSHI